MKESCAKCKGYICVDLGDGDHLMARTGGGIVYERIPGTVQKCTLRRDMEEEKWENDIEEWYELYGKLENFWLGC